MTRAVYDFCPPELGRRSTDRKVKGEALAYARALLHRFVYGGDIIVGYSESDIKLLESSSAMVWALRARMQPQIRLLGWFVAKDCFVAAVGRRRDQLGSLGSPQWRKAIESATQIREQLFGETMLPHSTRVEDLLSNVTT